MTPAAGATPGFQDRARDVAARLGGVAGWRAVAVAGLGGIAAAAALAPVYFLPGLIVGFAVLHLVLETAAAAPRRLWAGFVRGWAFGFGYFLVSIYWMSFSMLVQAESYAWMMPFAIFGMPAFLALFAGLAGAAVARSPGGAGARLAALAVFWSLAEYARGHVLTGLPWNLVGQSLAGTAAGVQTAAWWGPYGLSLAALVLALAPVAGLHAPRPRAAALALAAAAAGWGALYGVGAARLALNPPADRSDVRVRVVQPAIPQREKIDPARYWENLERNAALSEAPVEPGARTFVVWGENAAPLIAEEPEPRAYVSARLPEGATLLAGAVRRVEREGRVRYTNGLAVVRDGAVLATYDKHHLVPFGEYLPLNGALRALGLSQLAPTGDDGLTPGPGPRTIDLGIAPFSPLICYETIFPGAIHPPGERPEWIVVVTNDGWYGDTSGPRQHLDQARMRAVERGLPVARAANTGVSALIDAHGRYRFRIPLYEAGFRDAALPEAARPTLYARFGDAGYALMLIALSGFAILRARG